MSFWSDLRDLMNSMPGVDQVYLNQQRGVAAANAYSQAVRDGRMDSSYDGSGYRPPDDQETGLLGRIRDAVNGLLGNAEAEGMRRDGADTSGGQRPPGNVNDGDFLQNSPPPGMADLPPDVYDEDGPQWWWTPDDVDRAEAEINGQLDQWTADDDAAVETANAEAAADRAEALRDDYYHAMDLENTPAIDAEGNYSDDEWMSDDAGSVAKEQALTEYVDAHPELWENPEWSRWRSQPNADDARHDDDARRDAEDGGEPADEDGPDTWDDADEARDAEGYDAGPPMTAEQAARELAAADGIGLDEARGQVRDYLDDASARAGASADEWGLDRTDLDAIRSARTDEEPDREPSANDEEGWDAREDEARGRGDYQDPDWTAADEDEETYVSSVDEDAWKDDAYAKDSADDPDTAKKGEGESEMPNETDEAMDEARDAMAGTVDDAATPSAGEWDDDTENRTAGHSR